MEVQILKINESVFAGEAVSLTAPGVTGELQILSGHEPLVTVLQKGTISVKDSGGSDHSFDIEHGYLEVTPTQATIIL